MKKRVLVADDEPLTAEMFALMLAFTGYDVTRALDGEEALERARQIKPDVVLLDVMMPGKQGPDIARELRRDPAFEHKLLVLFSCVDEQEVAWREAGADAFLQKPVSLRDLPGILEELVRLKDEREQPEATV